MDVAEGCLPPLTGSISHYQAEDSGTQTARPATSEASTQTEGFEQEHASTQTRALCVEDVGCQRWCLWLSEQTPARLTLALWLRWPGYIEGIGAMLNGGDMQIGQHSEKNPEAPRVTCSRTSKGTQKPVPKPPAQIGLGEGCSGKQVKSSSQEASQHHIPVGQAQDNCSGQWHPRRELQRGPTSKLSQQRPVLPRHPHKDCNCDVMERGLSAIIDLESDGVCACVLLLGSPMSAKWRARIPASTALPPGSNVFAIGKAAAAERGGKRKKQKNWNGVRRWKHGWKGNSGLDSVLGRLSIHQQILTSEESAFHPLFS
ncbi:hypothetical protein Y1Q_0014977 [Alligator mississippiensis]|uniref:Uncharacterized protein n=1 Tax=Alligator mississippiensis TaxID=8496 RepID=A0A151N8P9_ALLMI|nr:hypothetical protein Y1Q_0014977 [Alligator mississippiensis]